MKHLSGWVILLSLFIFPISATGETAKGGSFRLIGQYAENPSDPLIYPDGSDYRGDIVARQFITADLRDGLFFDLNLYETVTHLKGETILYGLYSGTERSPSLEGKFFDDDYSKGEAAVDRLNIRLSSGRLDLTAGRQAINLATTFHFTPNDFFAPFSANTFYRVYKEGVDGVRGEVRIDELTQLSLIAVFGYEEDSSSSTGWGSSMDEGRNSYLARISTSTGNFEVSLLGGKVRKEKIFGGGFQGELSEWLGIRGEGHYARPDDGDEDDYAEAVIGLEHRFDNDLFLRLEHFYHGSGEGELADYSIPVADLGGRGSYLAERYSALSGNYQFTPLLVGDAAYIINHVDNSSLIALNGVYSLSDESELSVGVNLPTGDEPEGGALKSEFGLIPATVNLEYRVYY